MCALDLSSFLVQEVIDFVESGNLLKGLLSNKKVSFFIEKNFQKAQEFAFEQNIKHANLCWGDLKELEMSKVYGEKYKHPHYKAFSDQVIKLRAHFFKVLKNKLPLEFQCIIEEVVSDMKDSLENRAINGSTDNLIEKIYQAYKDGGWPCGWKGSYPEGKMIVFSS